jgi:hypothetical protein
MKAERKPSARPTGRRKQSAAQNRLPRMHVYVLNFHGDIRPCGACTARGSHLLTRAEPADSVMVRINGGGLVLVRPCGGAAHDPRSGIP